MNIYDDYRCLSGTELLRGMKNAQATVSLNLSLPTAVLLATSRLLKAHALKPPGLDVLTEIHVAEELTPPTMSYSKKDEDADTAMLRVDRTSVFQEGQRTPLHPHP